MALSRRVLLTVTPLGAQTRPLTLDNLYDPQRCIDFSAAGAFGHDLTV
jgi:hypothetical protein